MLLAILLLQIFKSFYHNSQLVLASAHELNLCLCLMSARQIATPSCIKQFYPLWECFFFFLRRNWDKLQYMILSSAVPPLLCNLHHIITVKMQWTKSILLLRLTDSSSLLTKTLKRCLLPTRCGNFKLWSNLESHSWQWYLGLCPITWISVTYSRPTATEQVAWQPCQIVKLRWKWKTRS